MSEKNDLDPTKVERLRERIIASERNFLNTRDKTRKEMVDELCKIIIEEIDGKSGGVRLK